MYSPLLKDIKEVDENVYIPQNSRQDSDSQNNNNNNRHLKTDQSEAIQDPLLPSNSPDSDYGSNKSQESENEEFEVDVNETKDKMKTSRSPSISVVPVSNSPHLKTRRVSLPGPNRHVFTVCNYGDAPAKDIMPILDENSHPVSTQKNEERNIKNALEHLAEETNDRNVSTGIGNHQDVPQANAINSDIYEMPALNLGDTCHKKKFVQKQCKSKGLELKPLKKNKTDHEIQDDCESVVNCSIDLDNGLEIGGNDSFLKPYNTFDGYSSTHNGKMSRTSSVVQFANKIANPFRDVIKRGKAYGRRKRDRLILKNGLVNLSSVHVSRKSLRFFQDMFTTLVDIKWRYMLLFLASAFLVTWIGFALIWWAVNAYQVKKGGPTCVIGVDDFDSALLFSVETQHTIGYGTRAVTTDCRLAIFFVMLQSLIGVTMSCVTTGLVFAKFARPKRRAQTLMFSKNSVIFENDGFRYLAFRVGDIRRSHMIQAVIQAVLFSHESGSDELPFVQHNLHVESEAENLYFLAWPIIVSHKIDRSSPLWGVSEENLLDADFEIVVVFEGTNSSTGVSTQICSSYLPSEIVWGATFVPLITGRRQSGQYLIDYEKFNQTVIQKLSPESAKQEDMKNKDFNDNVKVIPEITINIE